MVGLVLSAGIICILMRVLPPLLLKNKEFSPNTLIWLSYFPISLFTAMIAVDIFFLGENSDLVLNPLLNLKLIPSFIAILVAWKTKQTVTTVIAGLATLVLLTLLLS